MLWRVVTHSTQEELMEADLHAIVSTIQNDFLILKQLLTTSTRSVPDNPSLTPISSHLFIRHYVA